SRLALGVLRPAPGLVLAVLLALDDAAVAGQKTLLLQEWAQARLVIGQCPADAVAHRTGLAGQPAAFDGAPDIELAQPVGRGKGLVDQHAQHRPGEIDRAFAAVDVDLAGPRLDPYARDGTLALAGGISPTKFVQSRLDVDRRHLRNRRR